MTGTRNSTLDGKEFFPHNTAFSLATGDDHSLDITFPQIPDLIYQSDERRHNDGTTSLLTTNQAMLTVEEERKYLKADTFVEASWQTNKDIPSTVNRINCLPLLILQLHV